MRIRKINCTTFADGKINPLQHVVCLRAAYVHDSCSIGGGLGNGHVRRSAPVVQSGHYGSSQGNAHRQQRGAHAGQQHDPHDGRKDRAGMRAVCFRAAVNGCTAFAVAFGDFTDRHVAVSYFAPDHFVYFVHGGFSYAVE